ncbi:hypothetical protein OC846_005299 [Tilletia horrida]|uniref:DUF221-domain-containing protein n=1 Tax=Tilletia horrida TaxID=155126 RepID=A0AAN6GQU5_9BASI|nr:hypothetical protein OC845_005535 [Tilletia horrida]KAK0546366.1 hypothetical protein OC846_005299 [Tilletia horrida]KAK0562101.1 hypothetical protein OC861_005488 [Tilletia horrida]
MSEVLMRLALAAFWYISDEPVDGDDPNKGRNGPLPSDKSYQGPWFSQQIELSLFIGLLSILIFSALRRRATVLFAPRTRLIQFAPVKDHPELDIAAAVQKGSIFSWIIPTLRAPDSAILQLVGLDAHILLQFHKMTFWLLIAFAGWSAVILMPVNYMENGHIDGVAPWEDGRNQSDPDPGNNTTFFSRYQLSIMDDNPEAPLPYIPPPSPSPQATIYHLTHFVTTYLFTILTLRFLHTNYNNYIKARQQYALGVLDSIPARTVEIRDLPPQLRNDRALADYFERMGLMVESTAVVRHTGELSKLLKARADALRDLERAWCKWLGNPTTASNYDPDEIIDTFHKRQNAHIRKISMRSTASSNGRGSGSASRKTKNNKANNHDEDATEDTPLLTDPEQIWGNASGDISPVTHSEPVTRIEPPEDRPRPKMRASAYNPFSAKVDTLDELERRFRKLDAAVWKVRGNVGTSSGGGPAGYSDLDLDTAEGQEALDAAREAAARKAIRETDGADDDDDLDFHKGGRAHIKLRGGAVGFVTFVKASSAQIAAQVQHYPVPAQCRTLLAPEPRDIIWSNVSLSPHERRVRQFLVSAFVFGLLLFYIPPLTFLASFLSPQAIEHYLPWLADLLKKSATLRALVMNNASAILVASFNGMLPMALEWSGYLQGLRARSLVEYSVLKKYYLFLVVSVIFVFLVTSTAWGVLADLANNPMKSLDKIAALLPGARNFSLAYVIFQALAIVPLGLLQLPYIINRGWSRMWTITPREHAELNVPPMLYMGTVYPQALIVFTLSTLYVVVSPLLPIFGAIYFGGAYLVNKYKLIFVYYKSYESKGQAFPLCASRMIFSLLLFQVFQFSLFSFRKQFLFSTLIVPLFFGTFWYGRLLSKTFTPLSNYVNLQSIREMEAQGVQGNAGATAGKKKSGGADGDQTPQEAEQAGFEAPDELLPNQTADLRGSTPVKLPKPASAPRPDSSVKILTRPMRMSKEAVDPSLSLTASPSAAVVRSQLPNRPLIRDETLFLAANDKHTDYREPPGGNYFPGVLNTGRRRYGHPAATGVLPHLWLPIPADVPRKRASTLDAMESGELGSGETRPSTEAESSLRRTRTVSGAPSTSSGAVPAIPEHGEAPKVDADGMEPDGIFVSLRRRNSRMGSMSSRRRSLLSPLTAAKKAQLADAANNGLSRSKTLGAHALVDAGPVPSSSSTSAAHDATTAPVSSSSQASGTVAALVDAPVPPPAEGPGGVVAPPASSSSTSAKPEETAEPEAIDASEGDEESEDDEEAEEGVYLHRPRSHQKST